MLICSPVLHLFDKIAANNVHNVAIFVLAIKIIVTYNESFN
jgi:hypothetical protein